MSWWLLTPFLLDTMRKMACSHFVMGSFDSSKIVPTRTVNCLRQSPQNFTPTRTAPSGCFLLFDPAKGAKGEIRPMQPQCGQTGPWGQRAASTYSKAAASSWKWGWLRMDIALNPLVDSYSAASCVCKVHNRPC